jgi:hypothetical protein
MVYRTRLCSHKSCRKTILGLGITAVTALRWTCQTRHGTCWNLVGRSTPTSDLVCHKFGKISWCSRKLMMSASHTTSAGLSFSVGLTCQESWSAERNHLSLQASYLRRICFQTCHRHRHRHRHQAVLLLFDTDTWAAQAPFMEVHLHTTPARARVETASLHRYRHYVVCSYRS